MTNAKSTRIIAAGVSVFIIGGALLFLVLGRSSNNNSSKSQTNIAAPATTTVPPGSVIFPASPPTTVIQFKIPAGQNAIAVPMDYFAGGGGYVRTGDLVNIYSVMNKDCSNPAAPATVKMLLSNVKVLEVLGAAPAATGSASSYLLSVSPQDAEKIIFQSKFESLYFSLTTDNEPAVTTTGFNCSQLAK